MAVPARRRRRWLSWLAAGVVLVAGGGAAGWAVSTVLTPEKDVLESTPYTTVIVEPGTVGASITLNTAAEWTQEKVGTNRAAGIVTTVAVTAGDEVRPGDLLYTVDMRPVVIAEGAVPMYRDIGQGARGTDVAQLQRMLASVGYFSGKADGVAGSVTVRAIRAWERSLGLTATGYVPQGAVIFVPELPTRIALDEELIAIGETLNGGEKVVLALPNTPSFVLPVSDTQATMMPLGTRVEISVDDTRWEAFVVDHLRDEATATMIVRLEGPDGAIICGDECDRIPVTGQTLLSSRVIIVEEATGLVVPSAALRTSATGSLSVVDELGAEHPVTVIASARGMSVIEGVEAGLRVRVPAGG